MAKRTEAERKALAEKRLLSILARHGVATMRTLEQKISDAGPNDQRIDPHVLTNVRQDMVARGLIQTNRRRGQIWYSDPKTDERVRVRRLIELGALHDQTDREQLKKRLGQTLEIAVSRSLIKASQQGLLHFIGGFKDLDAHDDSKLYSKDEPMTFNGKAAPNGRCVDFISIHGNLPAAIEVKNIREWIYPNRPEIRELLSKSLALDLVPVLIARRIHFSTWSVLNLCGVVLHQTYNQRYPLSDTALADTVKRKDLLGYHDVRVGNDSDVRLDAFISNNLGQVLPDARARFEEYKDLMDNYANGGMPYEEFAARVKRRSRDEDEDGPRPWLEPEEF